MKAECGHDRSEYDSRRPEDVAVITERLRQLAADAFRYEAWLHLAHKKVVQIGGHYLTGNTCVKHCTTIERHHSCTLQIREEC